MNENEIKKHRDEGLDFINGKFVIGVKPTNESEVVFVKLAEIKSVTVISTIEKDGFDKCEFNLYKDQIYYAYLHAAQLVNAINQDLIGYKNE